MVYEVIGKVALLIELDAALEGLENLNAISFYETNEHSKEAYIETKNMLKALPTVDAVKVVRCKDCKHRPIGSNRDDLEFPDDKCPCECEDYWYSWKPEDEWYCGNGERKDGNA